MEQDMAILMADLSGYTALTETHGAAEAADLIDKYMEIVDRSLTGDCHFHQRTGDEVMIVSSSADQLIATALLLLQHTAATHNFLQLHGGLHYGKVLKRNDHYFGTTINLTARIAAKANPGSFFCSADYMNALVNKTAFTFSPKGKYSFKNISGETAVFELHADHSISIFIDPVCRMVMNKKEKAIPHPHEQDVFFCSHTCLDTYLRKNVSLPPDTGVPG